MMQNKSPVLGIPVACGFLRAKEKCKYDDFRFDMTPVLLFSEMFSSVISGNWRFW